MRYLRRSVRLALAAPLLLTCVIANGHTQTLHSGTRGTYDALFADPKVPSFLQPEITEVVQALTRTHGGPAESNNLDESSSRVLAELDMVKAELRDLKTKVSDLESDVLQTQDQVDHSQTQVTSIAGRLNAVLGAAASPAPLTFPLNTSEGRSLGNDVETTGSIAQNLTLKEEEQFSKVEELIRRGDIAGARLVLENGLGRHTPAALFKLAETYDPSHLRAWGVVGVKGDRQKARDLYEQARGAPGYAFEQRLARPR